jgi:hypothetical protein
MAMSAVLLEFDWGSEMIALTIIKSHQEDKTAMQKGDPLSGIGQIGLNALIGS